jgi:hypothetical protein
MPARDQRRHQRDSQQYSPTTSFRNNFMVLLLDAAQETIQKNATTEPISVNDLHRAGVYCRGAGVTRMIVSMRTASKTTLTGILPRQLHSKYGYGVRRCPGDNVGSFPDAAIWRCLRSTFV